MDRLKEHYRAARAMNNLWPKKRNGQLTESGREQAFMFIQGYVWGYSDATDTQANQTPTLWLCQVRGPDFAMGLNDDGTEKEPTT